MKLKTKRMIAIVSILMHDAEQLASDVLLLPLVPNITKLFQTISFESDKNESK
jgi:hypothetical protein